MMFLEVLTLIKHTARKCIICHYSYILDKGFKVEAAVGNGYYNILLKKSIDFNSIATLILTVLINGISKGKAIDF